MKRFLSCLFLVSLLLGVTQEQASAQIFRKLFPKKKEAPARKRPATTRPEQSQPARVTPSKPKTPARPKPFSYPATERKARYRMDVLVQLYLDELVKGNKSVYQVRIPDKATAGLNFYEGIKLATDTLGDYYNLDIYIHDVTANGKSPEQLVASGALDSPDLIVGALPSALLPPVANYARKREVNFVSALSPADAGIENNAYFTLLQPSLQTHCEWIANTIRKKYRREKPVILYRPSVTVEESARKYLVGDDSADYISINAAKLASLNQIASHLEKDETNVVVVAILDLSDADSMLRYLAHTFPEYRFDVYGMPTWQSINSFRKAGAFPNLTINFTAPFYFDATTASGQSVAKAYQRTFGGRPDDMVYRGFEAVHLYAYLLDRYGTIFNRHMASTESTGFTRFEIKPRYDKDARLLYNENMNLYLYRFQSGNFTVE